MDDYKKYLADQVVSEDKVVTYRTVSRALKVNVNIAKQMLYDFHSWQNGKKAGTVHATYVIYGTKQDAHANGYYQRDEDVEMTSSPPESAPEAEEVPVVTLSLVADENLRDVLAKYEKVISIYVYSLGPHPVKDMQLLADVSRPILDVADEDLVTLRPVRNSYVRRRERRNADQKAASASAPVKTKPAPVKAVSDSKDKEEPKTELKASSTDLKPDLKSSYKDAKADSKPSSKESTPVPSGAKKAAPKRGAAGGIMQSFAKAAAMPKKVSTPKPPAPEEDIRNLALSDDGEDDAEVMSEPKSKPEPDQETEGARRARKSRQEQLKRMMEESSEEEEEEPEKEATPMEEADEAPALEEEKKEDAEPAEVVSSTGNGRRRGRRQVKKKKTVMDEQGYLVTQHEMGWESFSEDETAAPSKKKVELASQLASQPVKPKKAGPKGQGNIMSFFSKK